MLCARWLQPLQPWYVVCLYHFISIHRLWVWDGRWLKTTRKTGILENRMPRSQDYGFCIFHKLGGVVLSFAPWWKHAVWGVVIPPSLGNRYNGSINPYQCGDDHPPILVYNPTLTIVGYIYIYPINTYIIYIYIFPAWKSHVNHHFNDFFLKKNVSCSYRCVHWVAGRSGCFNSNVWACAITSSMPPRHVDVSHWK